MNKTWLIPTYNGQELLQRYVPKVIEAMGKKDELIIVDDASGDSSVEWLTEQFCKVQSTKNNVESNKEKGRSKKSKLISYDITPPFGYFPAKLPELSLLKGKTEFGHDISIIALANNQRFAAAVNIGFLFANNELVFLLNNDVVPQKTCLDNLHSHFTQSDVFAVTCLEYESLDKKEISGKNKLWFERGLFHHSKADTFHAGETAWASGGSSLFSKSKWLELKGFDSLFYPAYWEDIDISYRAHKRGWKVFFEPKAIVYHRHETTNIDVFGQKKMMQMSWNHADAFTWKHANTSQKLQFLFWRPYWWVMRGRETFRLQNS